MQRRSIKIRTLTILFGILLVGAQFGSYYFLDRLSISAGITVILTLLLSHFYLEISLSYESCFFHSIITMVLSTICTGFIWYYQSSLLVYSDWLWSLTILNWFLPLLYCIFRNFGDRGPRFVGFVPYFVKTSILFVLYYGFLLVYCSFLSEKAFPFSASVPDSLFIPFMATATVIEDAIYLGSSILPLIFYVTELIVLFIPMGFYISLLLKKAGGFPKFILALFIPCIFEAVPLLYYSPKGFMTDNCLYRIIGMFLGMLLYQMINQLSHHFLGDDFLKPRNNYSFFNMYY